ncbi:MAG: transcription antitermination factor NusB [bacterium]|nr:transcription antitermination factor NusB [bacterium]
MAKPRDIRMLAFQALFQLDALSEGGLTAEDRVHVQESLAEVEFDEGEKPDDKDIEKAFARAQEAYEARRESDRLVGQYAPTWPAHRQPAVDRAILRLACWEMQQEGASPKAVINESVELAKRYSTERSPGFVNAVLDKIYKHLQGEKPEPVEAN